MNSRWDSRTRHLFLAHRAELVNYADAIVGGRSDAEDIVQEAFLRFDTVSRERSLDEPIAYLFRIVRNLSIDGVRKIARQRNGLSELKAFDGPGIETRSPEAIAIFRKELQVIHQALGELPERTRHAVTMHRIEGCKLHEIAERLGISVGLAHALVKDGLEHCRKRLKSAN